jgi:hypothetical protein
VYLNLVQDCLRKLYKPEKQADLNKTEVRRMAEKSDNEEFDKDVDEIEADLDDLDDDAEEPEETW